jgi:hypothetical protein
VITIEITNVEELVKQEKEWLPVKIVSLFSDLEEKVEKRIIEEIEDTFKKKGVKAIIRRQ